MIIVLDPEKIKLRKPETIKDKWKRMNYEQWRNALLKQIGKQGKVRVMTKTELQVNFNGLTICNIKKDWVNVIKP